MTSDTPYDIRKDHGEHNAHRSLTSWFTALLFLVGITALAVAGYLYWTAKPTPPPQSSLAVEDAERVFEGTIVGKHYDLEFRIVNSSAEPRRVVGSRFT